MAPPVPDIIRRVGIPLVGGLSLAAHPGCGAKNSDDGFLGTWNLVSQTYSYGAGSYTQHLPYAYSYSEAGMQCIEYFAVNLEVDSTTMGRIINIEGYMGCGDETTVVESDPVPISINGGTLTLTVVTETTVFPDGTTQSMTDEIPCQRSGATLTCEMTDPQVSLVFARPQCASDGDCSGEELCLAQQCIVPLDGDGGTSVTSGAVTGSTDGGGFSETGP